MFDIGKLIKKMLEPRNAVIILILLVIVVGTLGFITQKALEITENPVFCGKNCHIMRPFYDSWRTSTHNDVKCVECHYEPGSIGHIKGKVNGLMQFYRYETTEQYSGKFYAEVLDDNCLKCHKQRIFSGDAQYLGTNFSHRDHLLQPKRGVSLTCTSCHSMLVIGMSEHRSVTDPSCSQCHPTLVPQDVGHIVVTSSTCFTCHFRDVPGNTSISGCPSCHGPPVEAKYNSVKFDHQGHVGRGFECLTCHINVSTGANDVVPKQKCYECHNVQKRVDKYDDFQFVHKNHVTLHKIACYNCHSEVKHEAKVKPDLCSNCHKREHPDNWLSIHKTQVLIGKSCNDCHAPKFCADCHATGVAGVNKTKK